MTVFSGHRELLDQFRKGDRAALRTVYERYVDDVETLARRGFTIESSGHVYVRGVSGDGVRELVQDTFTRAFASSARTAYDGISPYRPYLLRITKNLMIDRHRAEQKRRGAVELDAPGGVGDIDAVLATNGMMAGSDPVDLDWAALRAATQDYLSTLDAATQRIIALRFEDELSQDEVSARTGCTRRRVRTVEAEVQAGLRKYLEQRGMYET